MDILIMVNSGTKLKYLSYVVDSGCSIDARIDHEALGFPLVNA